MMGLMMNACLDAPVNNLSSKIYNQKCRHHLKHNNCKKCKECKDGAKNIKNVKSCQIFVKDARR